MCINWSFSCSNFSIFPWQMQGYREKQWNSAFKRFQNAFHCTSLASMAKCCSALFYPLFSLVLCLGAKHNMSSRVKSKTRVGKEEIISQRKCKSFWIKDGKNCMDVQFVLLLKRQLNIIMTNNLITTGTSLERLEWMDSALTTFTVCLPHSWSFVFCLGLVFI